MSVIFSRFVQADVTINITPHSNTILYTPQTYLCGVSVI